MGKKILKIGLIVIAFILVAGSFAGGYWLGNKKGYTEGYKEAQNQISDGEWWIFLNGIRSLPPGNIVMTPFPFQRLYLLKDYIPKQYRGEFILKVIDVLAEYKVMAP